VSEAGKKGGKMSQQDLPEASDKQDEAVAAGQRKNTVLKVLSHPSLGILGIIGSLASLVSIPLAFYFYSESKEYPRLVYLTNPGRVVVVKAGQASRLTTSYDNRVITTDISAAQVAFWNAGKKPIKKGDVLKPVVIYTENNTPILEATVRTITRDVTHIALNGGEVEKGRVAISWDILEQNDGGVIQLIYAGSTDVGIHAEGIIEGQKQVEHIQTPRLADPNVIRIENRTNFLNFPDVVALTALLLVAAGTVANIMIITNRRLKQILLATSLIALISTLMIVLWSATSRGQGLWPPFSF
jgi:hypothetical protein